MTLVALVLEAFEEIVVFDVDAVLILQSHLDNYNQCQPKAPPIHIQIK